MEGGGGRPPFQLGDVKLELCLVLLGIAYILSDWAADILSGWADWVTNILRGWAGRVTDVLLGLVDGVLLASHERVVYMDCCYRVTHFLPWSFVNEQGGVHGCGTESYVLHLLGLFEEEGSAGIHQREMVSCLIHLGMSPDVRPGDLSVTEVVLQRETQIFC